MLLKIYHKHLTAVAVGIHGININHLCKLYRDLFVKRKRHRGKSDTVRFLRDLNATAERYAMYQPIEPMKFLKSDVDGFPLVIRSFRPYLRNEDPNVVKTVLSIFRSVELLRLPPSHDISTVVRQPNYDEKVVSDIIRYIPDFVKKLPKLQYKSPVYHYTVKNGPNGPALATSDTDLSAVRQDIALYSAICTVEKELGESNLPDENYRVTKPGIHSRITQFSEKAGKTRTIAVVDYYSQRALYPLHNAIMTLLRSLSSDGTFSHRNIGNYAKELTKDKSFVETSDMTAFTDLFPAVIQYKLLLHLVKSRDLAEAWWSLLAKRRFVVAWSGETVSYGTGQPMGAYASWPLCTLAHHLIMHYCAYKLRLRDVNKYYRILGDDNVRANEALSSLYEKTLRSLGCELNPNKGTCSRAGIQYSSAEVAKRLYLNGIDISPLTPGIIKSLLNPALINSALKEIMQSFDNPALPVHVLDHVVSYKHRDKCWMLCTNPFNGVIKPGNPGYDAHTEIWSDIIEDNEHNEVMRRFRIMSLVNKAAKLHEDHGGLLGLWARLQTVPQSPKESGGGDMELHSVPQYAMARCQMHILRQLFRALEKLKSPYIFTDDIRFDEVEYMPDPLNPFKDMKDVRNTQAALLVEKVYTFCKAREDVMDLRWRIPPTLKI